MATPHVAGAAAVLFSAKPAATVAQVKAALLGTGDPLAALTGKTVSGRRLNLDAALRAPAIRPDTIATITSHDPEPSVPGQPVTIHYSVTTDPVGAGTPTGDVTVSDGGQTCTATVAAGQCTLTFPSPGAKTLTAFYTGDAYDNASPTSAGATHHVVRAATATTITQDTPDPSSVGAPVTVAVHVVPLAPGSGTPAGSVTVTDGIDSCSTTVAAGSCAIALTTAGSRPLTATYGGDANFAGSTSAPAAHTVSPPAAHVTNARASHRTFRVSASPSPAQASRKRPPIGTSFSYQLDNASTVRFDFTQPSGGRKVKGKCVAPTAGNKRKAKCTLRRGSLSFAGHPGTNTVRFKGWLTRHKKLTPGKYTLTITAGTSSQKLTFTVVR
jgi:hypothetical protein